MLIQSSGHRQNCKMQLGRTRKQIKQLINLLKYAILRETRLSALTEKGGGVRDFLCSDSHWPLESHLKIPIVNISYRDLFQCQCFAYTFRENLLFSAELRSFNIMNSHLGGRGGELTCF